MSTITLHKSCKTITRAYFTWIVNFVEELNGARRDDATQVDNEPWWQTLDRKERVLLVRQPTINTALIKRLFRRLYSGAHCVSTITHNCSVPLRLHHMFRCTLKNLGRRATSKQLYCLVLY